MSYYNKLVVSEKILDGYSRWSDYRREITNFILDSTVSSNNGGIILGAGNCNDLDIERLLNTFTHLLLVDRDADAMREAICKYGLEDSNRIKILQCDFTMASNEHYIELENMLNNKKYFEEIIDWITNFIMDCNFAAVINAFVEEWGIIVDTIVCIGVHSQLAMRLVKLVDFYKGNYSENEYMLISKQIQILSDCMSQNLNKQIYNINGIKNIFIGYEYSTFYIDSQYSASDIKNMFCKGKAELVDMLKLPRVEGAYQCEQDISTRFNLRKIKIEGCNYSVWPFSEDKEYLMINYLINVI